MRASLVPLAGFFIILVGALFFVGLPATAQLPDYTISGDRVFIDDANAFLSAEPHTLYSSGWVYFNITSKIFTGDVDAAWGFDTTQVRPKKAELYDPRDFNITQTFTCSGSGRVDGDVVYSDHWLNYTLQPKYFWCWQNVTTSGETVSQLIYGHDFEVADLPTKTARWNITRSLIWRDVSDKFSSITQTFQDVDKWWFVTDIPVVAGENYQLRVWVEMPVSQEQLEGKYYFAIKPSFQTISQAVSAGTFYFIDPWFDTAFLKRVRITVNNTASTALSENYTVNLTLDTRGADFQDDGDDVRIVFDDGSTQAELDRFNLSPFDSANTLIFFKLNQSVAAGSLDENYYVYYSNTGAGAAPANASRVFLYYQDFNALAVGPLTSVDLWSGSGIYDVSDQDNSFDVGRDVNISGEADFRAIRLFQGRPGSQTIVYINKTGSAGAGASPRFDIYDDSTRLTTLGIDNGGGQIFWRDSGGVRSDENFVSASYYKFNFMMDANGRFNITIINTSTGQVVGNDENRVAEGSVTNGVNNFTLLWNDQGGSGAIGRYDVMINREWVFPEANLTTGPAIDVDNGPPNVTIQSPINMTYENGTVSFNASVLEQNPAADGVVQLTMLDTGQTGINYTLTNRSGNWGYTNLSIPVGVYQAQFFINDTVGNVNNTENVTFTIFGGIFVESVLPNGTNQSRPFPEFQYLVNSTSTVNIEAFIEVTNSTNIMIVASNASITNGTLTFNISNTSLGDGWYNWTVNVSQSTVINASGLANFSIITSHFLDQLRPLNGNYTNDPTPNLTFIFNSTRLTSARIDAILFNDTDIFAGFTTATNGSETNITVNQTLGDGEYNWTVNISQAGISNGSLSFNFTVDTTLPTATGITRTPAGCFDVVRVATYTWQQNGTHSPINFSQCDFLNPSSGINTSIAASTLETGEATCGLSISAVGTWEVAINMTDQAGNHLIAYGADLDAGATGSCVTPGAPGGSPGGGPGVQPPILIIGDGICGPEETIENSPADCTSEFSFDARPEIVSDFIWEGRIFAREVLLINQNERTFTITGTIECVTQDPSCDWVKFAGGQTSISLELTQGTPARPTSVVVPLFFEVPTEISFETFQANIVFASEGFVKNVPISLQPFSLRLFILAITDFIGSPFITLPNGFEIFGWMIIVLVVALILGVAFFLGRRRSRGGKSLIPFRGRR